MNDGNPYAPPRTEPVAVPTGGRIYPKIELVASGQRMIIIAILLNVATVALRVAVGPAVGILGIATVILSLAGVFRVATGLEIGMTARVLLLVSMLVPLANLIALVFLNSRATRALRDSGYRVGLLGASK
jgi:hypothetical protein